MSFSKKTLNCILCASLLFVSTTTFAGELANQLLASEVVMFTGLFLARDAGDTQFNIINNAVETNQPFSNEISNKLVGSTARYEQIIDGQKVSINQRLNTIEDVRIFDQRRLEAMRLSRIDRLKVTTRRMRINGAVGTVMVVGGMLAFGGLLLSPASAGESNANSELPFEEVQVQQ